MINDNNYHILTLIIINIFIYLSYPLSILFKNKIDENLKNIIDGILIQLSIYYFIITIGIIYYLTLNINLINDSIILNNDSSNNELIDEYSTNKINIYIILFLLMIIIYLQIKLSKNQYDLLK